MCKAAKQALFTQELLPYNDCTCLTVAPVMFCQLLPHPGSFSHCRLWVHLNSLEEPVFLEEELYASWLHSLMELLLDM